MNQVIQMGTVKAQRVTTEDVALTLWHVLVRRRNGERRPRVGVPCSGGGGAPRMRANGGTGKCGKDLNWCRGRVKRGP